MDSADSMPAADPAFLAHFTDPLYQDRGDELAPFGSDEGSDMLSEWADHTEQLTSATSLQEFLQLNDLAGIDGNLGKPRKAPRIPIPVPGGHIDAATQIVSSAFTLLYYTGQIDPAGRELAVRALDVEIAYYDSPAVLLKQRADLESWPS